MALNFFHGEKKTWKHSGDIPDRKHKVTWLVTLIRVTRKEKNTMFYNSYFK